METTNRKEIIKLIEEFNHESIEKFILSKINKDSRILNEQYKQSFFHDNPIGEFLYEIVRHIKGSFSEVEISTVNRGVKDVKLGDAIMGNGQYDRVFVIVDFYKVDLRIERLNCIVVAFDKLFYKELIDKLNNGNR